MILINQSLLNFLIYEEILISFLSVQAVFFLSIEGKEFQFRRWSIRDEAFTVYISQDKRGGKACYIQQGNGGGGRGADGMLYCIICLQIAVLFGPIAILIRYMVTSPTICNKTTKQKDKRAYSVDKPIQNRQYSMLLVIPHIYWVHQRYSKRGQVC